MAVHKDREAFIPFRKADVVELCVRDGKLDAKNAQKFHEFCDILAAYYHFDFHKTLETLKDNFSPFNPDTDTKTLEERTPEQLREMEENLVKAFAHVLEKANYTKLSEEAKAKALAQESLITLKMDVDFNDFDQMLFYHRGAGEQTVQVKKMFKMVDFTMETYGRVVLLIKFKDAAYFKAKGQNPAKLNFTPGKTYVYMYKNIPTADIEVLFPNVQVSMAMKDRLMLIGPALLGGVLTMLKVGAALAGLIFVLWEIYKGTALDQSTTAQVIAGLTGLGLLGAFCFKQYVAYKNKRIKFLKDVTDTLFFRCLDCNGGVFNTLVDSAEEEECKEAILAYYHLLVNKQGLNQEQLDDTIENWLEEKYNAKVDFNVEKALAKLSAMKGKIVKDGQDEDSVPETALVSVDANGVCRVPSIDDSKTIIDYVWDNLFSYNES